MPEFYSKSKAQPGDIPSFLEWEFDDVLDYLSNNVVASIIFVDHTGHASALYMPRRIEGDDTNKNEGLVGNLSDERGTFLPVSIMNNADIVNGIIFIEKWDDVPPAIRPNKALEADVLEGTPWSAATHKLCLVRVSTIIPGRFWMADVPQKSVKDDDFEDAFRPIGSSYANWAKCIKAALEFYDNDETASAIGEVFGRVMKKINFSDYADFTRQEFDGMNELAIIPSFSWIEKLYPKSTKAIKDYFAPPSTPQGNGTGIQPTAQVPPQQTNGSFSPGMRLLLEQHGKMLEAFTGGLTFTTHEDKTRETAAAYGLHKLWLFGVTGTIDWERGEVSNIHLPSWSKTMDDYVEAKELTGLRRMKVRDFLTTVFNHGFKNLSFSDRINPLHSKRSMTVIPDTLVRAILAGEFQTTPLGSNLMSASNEVTILHFLPQKDVGKVQQAQANEQKRSAQFMLANKTTNVDHTLQVIGTIESIDDITSIVANLHGVFGNIFDNTKEDKMPVILQVVCKMVETLACHKVTDWISRNQSKQPQLPFLLLGQLHSVFAGLGEFSNHTVNTSVADLAKAQGREGEPLRGLEAASLQGCVRRLAKFVTQIEQKTVDDQVFTSVPPFTPPNRDPSVANLREVMQRASLSVGTANVAGNVKENARKAEESPASSPTKEESKTSKRAKKRAKRRGADKDSDKSEENKRKGFVHKKPEATWTELFNPSVTKIEKKPCGKFCSIGFNCGPKSTCSFDHLSSWKHFPESDQEALLKHWNETGLGWLDEDKLKEHNIELPEKYAHLKGDASGPKKKST